MSGERIGVLETKMPEPQAGRRDDPNPGKRHAHEIVVEQRGFRPATRAIGHVLLVMAGGLGGVRSRR